MTNNYSKEGDRINIGTSKFHARLITDENGNEILPINDIMRDAGLQAICNIINRLPKNGIENFYHVFIDFNATVNGVIAPEHVKKDKKTLISLSDDYYDLRIDDNKIKLKLGQLFKKIPNNIKEFVTPDTNVKTPFQLKNGLYCAYFDYEIPLKSLNAIAIPDYVTGDKSENGFYFGVQFKEQGRF